MRLGGLVVLLASIVSAGLVSVPRASAVGASWSPPYFVDAFGTPTAVSCSSPSFCAGVDDSGDAGVWTGSTSAAGNRFDPGNAFTSISCVSPSFCMAVDNVANAFEYNGSSWIDKGNLEGSVDFASLGSVSCVSTSFCIAVDNNLSGSAFVYNGSGWSDSGLVSPDGFVTSVSCPTTHFCMAVDDWGNAMSYDGSSWTTYSEIDPILESSDGQLPGPVVSCASPTMCVEGDPAGQSLTFDGTNWSAPQMVNIDFTGLSCPTATFCMAVDSNNSATFNGTSWSHEVSSEPAQDSFVGVSCPMTSFCGAGDDSGDFLIYSTPEAAPVVINPVLALAKRGVAYPAKTFHARGGVAPYHWKKIGTVPKGMKFKNGVLSGTPKATDAAGIYRFSVSVRDSTKPAHKTTTVRVALKVT